MIFFLVLAIQRDIKVLHIGQARPHPSRSKTSPRLDHLGGLAPLRPHADQRADGTGDADQAVIQLGEAQGGDRDGQIAQVGDELYPGGGALPASQNEPQLFENPQESTVNPVNMKGENILLNLLRLNNTLTLLPINSLLLLLQTEQRINTRHSTAHQARQPRPVSTLLQTLDTGQLAVPDGIDHGNHVQRQVSGVAKLATDGEVAQDGVDGALVVESDGGGLEVFGELADAQDLAGRAELLLHCVVRVDGGLGLVGAVEVPGVEAGEVLDCAEELVAADWMDGWVSLVVGLGMD